MAHADEDKTRTLSVNPLNTLKIITLHPSPGVKSKSLFPSKRDGFNPEAPSTGKGVPGISSKAPVRFKF